MSMAEEKKPNKQEKLGEVVSDRMAKTIVVQVARRVAHPLYKRIVTKHKKFYAHDEEGKAKMGDIVRIVESRPMSKLKRWALAEVLRKAVIVTVDLPDGGDAQSVANKKKSATAKKKRG
jgi:small subunit ribosomal protein S17